MNDWDANSERLFQNLRKVQGAARDAAVNRQPPSLALARDWHATMMEGLDVVIDGRRITDHSFFGTFRGEPGLETCEVRVDGHFGVPAAAVGDHLAAFERTLARAVEALDGMIPAGELPGNADQLNAVITLCAWAHAEWVRIHPFGNGNGRTARVWAGFIAMRYGVDSFVTLRPRPDGGYASAGEKAMEGDWRPTAALFRQMYLEFIANG